MYLVCRMFVDFEMLPFWWNSRTISLRVSHEDIWKINDKPTKRIYDFVRLVAKLQKCKPWRGDICPTGWKSTRSSRALDEGWLSPTVLTLKRFLAIKTTAIGAAFWVDYDKHSFFWNCWLPLSVRLEMTDFLPNEGIDNNHSKTIVMGNKEKRISFGFLMNLGTPLTAKLKADGGETWVDSSHLHMCSCHRSLQSYKSLERKIWTGKWRLILGIRCKGTHIWTTKVLSL